MLPFQRGGAGLDQPDLRLSGLWGNRAANVRPVAEPPRIAPVERRSERRCWASSAQGSLGLASATVSNRCLGFLEAVLLLEHLGDSEMHGRQQGRLRKSLQCRLQRGQGRLSGSLRSSSIVASSSAARPEGVAASLASVRKSGFGLSATLESQQNQRR